MFKGSIPALVTPFDEGAVDYKRFESFLSWQVEQGSNGVVPVGTTGESPTLSHQEHMDVVKFVVDQINGRVPVMAGAGSNATSESIEFAQHAEAVGADAILVVAPYYNKPTQEGLFAHFKAVHDACGLPLYMYNIPGRSVIDISVDTMKRLFDLPRIVGVKDATAKLDRVSLQRHAIGEDFIQISGEDATALGFNAHGGAGCISVTANVAPALCAQLQALSLAGDYAAALKVQDKLMPLHSALFAEASPGPAKYALSRLGHVQNEVRLPLVPITTATQALIDEAMAHAGLM